MGARVEFAGAADGLPLTVHGAALRPLEWESESASAQVKSALLLAGTRGGVVVRFREPYRSRDHTERMLRAQGVSIGEHDGWIVLEPPGHLTPLDCDVPGDPSAAAFPVALGALAGGGRLVVRGVGLNPGRTGFLDVLRRMGADLDRPRAPGVGTRTDRRHRGDTRAVARGRRRRGRDSRAHRRDPDAGLHRRACRRRHDDPGRVGAARQGERPDRRRGGQPARGRCRGGGAPRRAGRHRERATPRRARRDPRRSPAGDGVRCARCGERGRPGDR